MRRLPRGTLTPLAKRTGFAIPYLSDLVSARKRPGRQRAKFLETAAREIGKNIPAIIWLYGSGAEIRAALVQE